MLRSRALANVKIYGNATRLSISNSLLKGAVLLCY